MVSYMTLFWLTNIITLICLAAGATLVAAAISAVGQKWQWVLSLSRWTTAMGATAAGLALGLFLTLYIRPRTLDGAEDPLQRARMLGETTAELVNCGAFSLLVVVIAFPLWFIARWRLRTSPKSAGS